MASAFSSFTRSSGRSLEGLRHPRIKNVRHRRDPTCIRPAAIARFVAPRAKDRGTKRPMRRSSPRSWASPPRTCSGGGRHDTAPYGLGTYASRSTPDFGRGLRARRAQDPRQGEEARRALARGKRKRSRVGARKFSVKGAPQKSKTIQECAFAAYTNHPQGMEAGLEAVHYYDPPNLTSPSQLHLRGGHRSRHGRRQGEALRRRRRLRQHHQPDDRRRPDPRRPDQGIGPALYEEISYDDEGNISGGSFLDYYVPTSLETPNGRPTRPPRLPRTIRSARRRGRVGDRGRAARDRQRRGRRSSAPRGDAPRHPDHAGKGVDDPEEQGRRGVASGSPVAQAGSIVRTAHPIKYVS